MDNGNKITVDTHNKEAQKDITTAAAHRGGSFSLLNNGIETHQSQATVMPQTAMLNQSTSLPDED